MHINIFYFIIIKLNIFKLENKLSVCLYVLRILKSFEGKVFLVFRQI